KLLYLPGTAPRTVCALGTLCVHYSADHGSFDTSLAGETYVVSREQPGKSEPETGTLTAPTAAATSGRPAAGVTPTAPRIARGAPRPDVCTCRRLRRGRQSAGASQW